MPVLPLIDGLIFVGWSSLMVSFVLKGISMSTHYKPAILGLSAGDFLTFSMVSMLFAVALAARTWVKANEHRLLRAGRLQTTPEAHAAQENGWNGHPEASAESNAGRQVAAGR